MKTVRTPSALVLIGILSATLLMPHATTFAKENTREIAQVLLDYVKKRRLESEIAVKQTELQRLDEDQKEKQEEVELLQRTIDAISTEIGTTSGSLDVLGSERKRLTDLLALANQRIEAERLKSEGLKALSDAQVQARALAQNLIDELSLRSDIGKLELVLLQQKQSSVSDQATAKVADAKQLADLAELKRKLVRYEKKNSAAARIARDSMTAASNRLSLADKADAKAKKTAGELAGVGAAPPPDDKAPLEPIAAPPDDKAPVEPIIAPPADKAPIEPITAPPADPAKQD